MQVRHVLVASVLAAAAAGAMSQEIDRSETLQARNFATQPARAESSQGRTRESVVTETRQALASGQILVGERADGLPVDTSRDAAWAKHHFTQPYAKTWLRGDRHQPRYVVADRG
jgi:hypothetical protein